MTQVVERSHELFPGLRRLKLLMGMQCNARCTMCYQTDFSPRSTMDSVIYKEYLKPAYSQVRHIKILGGEPTIIKGCREAAKLLRDYPNAKLTITTNGIFMDDFWLDTFIHQGELIEISINAASEDAYNKIVIYGKYRKLMRNLERLLAGRAGKTPAIHLTSVILKDNVNEIAALTQLAADLRVDHVGFITDPVLSRAAASSHSQVRPELIKAKKVQEKTGMSVVGLDVFERQFKSKPGARVWPDAPEKTKAMCPMPFFNLSVDWNGDVRVCGNTWVKVGNLYNSELSQIWNGKIITEFRSKLRCGDYSWCSPTCVSNINPTRMSLANKYAYQLREDPKQFAMKVQKKATQVLGTLVTIKEAASS